MAYIVKRIGQAYILWIEASNQWVQFDELQWLIFCFYEKGIAQGTAVAQVASRFSMAEEKAKSMVESIYQSLDTLFNPTFYLPNFSLNAEKASGYVLKDKKTGFYRHLGKSFSITYGPPQLQRYIHWPLAHLETDTHDRCNFNLEVFPFEKRYALRINGPGGECRLADESGQIKRLLYLELTNYLYDKNEDGWLSFVHGSALAKNDNVLILTSSEGSGKSTMAALLMLRGLTFLSDDYVPIESDSQRVYAFPAALSLKNDAIELMKGKGMVIQTFSQGKIGFAKHNPENQKVTHGKVKNIVFIKYCKEKELLFEKVSTLDALALFLNESWVGNDIKRAQQFIDWFSTLNFHRLEYGNNDKAIEALCSLVE